MLKSFVAILFLISSFAHGQTSPLNSAPGEGPPPQGWDLNPPPDGGIHMPKKKRNLQLEMEAEEGDDDEAAPTPTPAPHSKHKKTSPQSTPTKPVP